MPFVVDASVASNWFFPDEAQAAIAAWQRIANDDGWVPLHWWFEIRNAMLAAERRARITEQFTTHALARLSLLRIVSAPRPNDVDVMSMARRHRLTFYDAAYLELAKREDLPLATLDKTLARAASSEGVPLLAD